MCFNNLIYKYVLSLFVKSLMRKVQRLPSKFHAEVITASDDQIETLLHSYKLLPPRQ